jgi:AAHS family 4-hydroxybenzoate transporter-like MFS transporter
MLFSPQYRLATITMWIALFFALFYFYLATSWLPFCIQGTGLSIADVARVAALLPVGGICGSILIAWLVDRSENPVGTIVISYLLAALAMLGLGLAFAEGAWLKTAVFATGFFMVGSQNGINLLAVKAYPPSIRATGVGSVHAVGRVGSIIGSMAGGALLVWLVKPQYLFALVAMAPALGGAALAVIWYHKKRYGSALKADGWIGL